MPNAECRMPNAECRMSNVEEMAWGVVGLVIVVCSLAMLTYAVVTLYQSIPDDPFGLGDLDL